MPQFMLKKGIRVYFDKQNNKIESECYAPTAKTFITDEHIKQNFKIQADSNLNRIPNQYIIDFRDKMIKENFKKIETK